MLYKLINVDLISRLFIEIHNSNLYIEACREMAKKFDALPCFHFDAKTMSYRLIEDRFQLNNVANRNDLGAWIDTLDNEGTFFLRKINSRRESPLLNSNLEIAKKYRYIISEDIKNPAIAKFYGFNFLPYELALENEMIRKNTKIISGVDINNCEWVVISMCAELTDITLNRLKNDLVAISDNDLRSLISNSIIKEV